MERRMRHYFGDDREDKRHGMVSITTNPHLGDSAPLCPIFELTRCSLLRFLFFRTNNLQLYDSQELL